MSQLKYLILSALLLGTLAAIPTELFANTYEDKERVEVRFEPKEMARERTRVIIIAPGSDVSDERDLSLLKDTGSDRTLTMACRGGRY